MRYFQLTKAMGIFILVYEHTYCRHSTIKKKPVIFKDVMDKLLDKAYIILPVGGAMTKTCIWFAGRTLIKHVKLSNNWTF